MIKKFEAFDQSKDDFEIGKKSVLQLLNQLIEEYEDWSNDVSPSSWRLTGHHITELKKMKEEIERVNPISIEEKENEWVKEQRFKDDNTTPNAQPSVGVRPPFAR
jgi:hypothetical protein